MYVDIMNINFNQKKYWVIPVLLALALALIVTLSSKWPLSWDIYTHINYVLTYVNYGITTVDPYLNAPHGKQIGYVPLFHVLFMLLSFVMQTDFITTARIIQIISPVIITMIIMFVTYKFYNEIAAFVAGLLLISSFMFTRMLLPIPETIAIMFFIMGIYLFYESFDKNNMMYAFCSGIISLIMLGLHFSSCIYYLILLTCLMMVQLIISRDKLVIKSYCYVLLAILLAGICGFIALMVIAPSHLSQLFAGVFSILSDPMSLFMGQKAMGLERYIKCIGLLPLLCGIIGLYYSFKEKELLFISLWALITFVFSNLHWFGIPVYTFRMLLYLIIPTVILGGYAVAKLCDNLNDKNKSYTILLILVLIIVSYGCGYASINDVSVKTTSATTQLSDYQIAPPTSDEEEVINWFKTQDTENKSVLSNNLFFATVISSVDEMPMHYKFDVYTNKSSSKSSLKTLNNEKIGYILYDKDLVLNNSTKEELKVQYVNGSYYPTYYFTEEITKDNFNQIKLDTTEKVFENDRFIICKVEN